jgi:hypothetical protein
MTMAMIAAVVEFERDLLIGELMSGSPTPKPLESR